MTLDISDRAFKKVLDDKELFLPIRWDGRDFSAAINQLFDHYIERLAAVCRDHTPHDGIHISLERAKEVIEKLELSADHYLNGSPFQAFKDFIGVMDVLNQTPLQVYQKSVFDYFDTPYSHNRDTLKLFRAVRVSDNKPYPRTRVFHTPYDLRSKVSTNRYSIAGFPSLYLGTSLELCCEEIHANHYKDPTIASLFQLQRNFARNHINIRVIELGVKPQDFLEQRPHGKSARRIVPQEVLRSQNVKSEYLLWYPLIAACSFIRANKSDPFAAEYIIPQLLMQWVRSKAIPETDRDGQQLTGIRYFSCASVKASDMGFNYVFPTSGRQVSADFPYCSVLSKAFRLTKPVFIREYGNIHQCEQSLTHSNDLDYINAP